MVAFLVRRSPTARGEFAAPAAAAVLAALLLALPEAAHAASAVRPQRPTLALTVSGGVSLGAYEAGFLYYTLAAAQTNPWLGDLKLATGASAGSVNALLALRSACSGVSLSPSDSLLAQVWLPVGFRQLFVAGEASPLGAFSQVSLEEVADKVEADLQRGLPATCDVVLGLAVTRVTPRPRPIAGGRLSVPRTEEKFALRLQGRGAGRMPRITNYVDPAYEGEQALLPEEADGSVAFPHVRDALLASTAFPVAFPPRAVSHCVVQTQGARRPFCPAASARPALFIDGGVFDNTPLRLAAWLAAAGLRPGSGGQLAWQDDAAFLETRPPDDVVFGFLSADARAYPSGEERRASPAASVPSLLGEELATFVETARTRELGNLVSEFPHVAEGIIYPQRHFPAASEPLYAFFGFFERAFRAHDFALGMYEARRQLVNVGFPRAERARPGATPVFPEDTAEGRAAAAGWRPLTCMRAVFDGGGDAPALCAGDDLRDLRIVMQVSLDRLWDLCRAPVDPDAPPASERACRLARAGAPVPRVPGVAPLSDPERRPSESEAVHAVRLLAGYGFEWRDMGFGRAGAKTALTGLRGDLGAVARALARRQPDLASRSMVGAGGELAADAFYYLPPVNTAWVTLGRALEIGASASVEAESWLRLGGAIKLQNLFLGLSSDPLQVSLLPVAGGAFVPAGIGSAFFQPSFLVRGGWNLSLANGADCSGSNGSTIGGCSRPELEGGVGLTFAGVVRVQVMVEWYPPALEAPGLWALAPSLGFQLGF
jgi:hypothetical protein